MGDADHRPQGYPIGAFGVVDEGADNVKVYNVNGSFLGVWRTVSANTVGYAVGGHMEQLIYLGTSDGVISVHRYSGSFITSFATGVPLADLGSAAGYRGWGEYVHLGPARSRDPVRVYNWGSLCGTFHLPGLRNAGTVIAQGGRFGVGAFATPVTRCGRTEPASAIRCPSSPRRWARSRRCINKGDRPT